jgi:prepilin-type N-terminal cleavage/methylation domain-containing protein
MVRSETSHTTRHARRTGRRAQREGFTLMELMVVIAVIAITAALAGPSVHQALAERRHMEAGADLVLLARRARAEAAAQGRAYMIRFEDTVGSFTLYKGTVSACNANDWDGTGAGNDIIAASDCTNPDPGHCIDVMAATDSAYTLGATTITITESTGRSDIDMCWEPSGAMWWRDGGSVGSGGRFTDRNTVNGGFLFLFQRDESGTPTGVDRRVVVPLSGQARVLR